MTKAYQAAADAAYHAFSPFRSGLIAGTVSTVDYIAARKVYHDLMNALYAAFPIDDDNEDNYLLEEYPE